MKLFLSLLCLIVCVNTRVLAQDWPNLKRFEKDNSALITSTTNKNRVVFMGNSITEGWSGFNPSFFAENNYINRGISGQTTPQMLVRFRADVVDLEPEVVVILAGINDIAGNTGPSTIKMIADNIKSMAEIAHANGIKVIISSVLPANDFPWRPGMEPADKVIALNQELKAFTKSSNFLYLDYYSALVDDKKGMKKIHSKDGVHPTKAGYDVMEPIVKAAIDIALKGK